MSSFTISTTVATFRARVNGSSQEAGDIEKLTLSIILDTVQEWTDLSALLTTKYHVHVPLSGTVLIDVVRGPGIGSLVLDGRGTASALLVEARDVQYLRSGRSIAQAVFLRTTVWT